MTAVSYPDLETYSSNGRFQLSAVSPDAGPFQKNFVYRLISDDKLLWEHTQRPDEHSPHELFLSDNGWCIVRTHGIVSGQLVIFSPAGVQSGMVNIVSGRDKGAKSGDVVAQNAIVSTAGLYWTEGAFFTFFEHQDEPYFVVATSWLEPIIVDLQYGYIVESPSNEFREHMNQAQIQQVGQCLQSALESGERWQTQCPCLAGAILLAAQLEWDVRDELLRSITSIPDGARYRTSCRSLERSWDVEPQYLSPLLQAALRRIGCKVDGVGPSYRFTRRQKEDLLLPPTTGPDPKDLPDSALELLEKHGPPHFLNSYSEKGPSGRHSWGERWEYYLGVGEVVDVLRLDWAPGSQGKELRSKEIVQVDLLQRLSELCCW